MEMIDAHLDEPECPYSDSDLARAKQEIAQEMFDDMHEDAREFMREEASEYIVGLARGGDSYNETRAMLERDCVGYLAEQVPTARAIERCRGEDVAAREEA